MDEVKRDDIDGNVVEAAAPERETSTANNDHGVQTAAIEDPNSTRQASSDEDTITAKKAAIYDHVLEVLTSNVYGNLVNPGAATGKDGRLDNLVVYVELKQMLEDDKAQREHLMAMMAGDAAVEGKRKGRHRGMKDELSAAEARVKETEADNAALLDKINAVERHSKEVHTGLSKELSSIKSKNIDLEKRLAGMEQRCKNAEIAVVAPEKAEAGTKETEEQLSALGEAEILRRKKHIDIVRKHTHKLAKCVEAVGTFVSHQKKRDDLEDLAENSDASDWSADAEIVVRFKQLHQVMELNDHVGIREDRGKAHISYSFARPLSAARMASDIEWGTSE